MQLTSETMKLRLTFDGFGPNKIGGDIPVLEAIYRGARNPQRIVGYSDASVRCFPLDNISWPGRENAVTKPLPQ